MKDKITESCIIMKALVPIGFSYESSLILRAHTL